MKKKVFAIISAAVLFAFSSMPVFAASSKVTGPDSQKCDATLTSKSAKEYANSTSILTEGFTVAAVDEATATAAEAAVVANVLKDVAAFAKSIGDDNLKAAATDSTKKVDAEVLSVVNISSSNATKGTDGYYTFEIGVSGVKTGDFVLAMHLPEGATSWIYEYCVAGDNKVTVKSTDCSPFSIVKVTVTNKNSSTNNKNGNSNTPTSPKTGETAPIVLIISLAGLTGAAYCFRKIFS